MRRSTQNSGLKLVMLFDRRNQTCSICSHNLDIEDASQEVAELRRDGLPAFTLDQRSRHVPGRSGRMRCLPGGYQAVDQSATCFPAQETLILPLVSS
ncbi:MAG: hypothetical protein DMG70_00595 [Acidobacteria bacterium]|nr:MAG: hypothetical protein DMG70_00595 [Acidobacteriota bacterium]